VPDRRTNRRNADQFPAPPEGRDELLGEASGADQRQRGRVPSATFDRQLEVVVPVHPVIDQAVGVRAPTPRPVHHLRHFRHHGVMLLNCRRRHRFQRKDAIHDLVPVDGVQARPRGRKQKAMSQWNGTGGTEASAPPKGPPRGAYYGQAASPPAPRGFAQPIGAGSDS
jgi:hypothetical protein